MARAGLVAPGFRPKGLGRPSRRQKRRRRYDNEHLRDLAKPLRAGAEIEVLAPKSDNFPSGSLKGRVACRKSMRADPPNLGLANI